MFGFSGRRPGDPGGFFRQRRFALIFWVERSWYLLFLGAVGSRGYLTSGYPFYPSGLGAYPIRLDGVHPRRHQAKGLGSQLGSGATPGLPFRAEKRGLVLPLAGYQPRRFDLSEIAAVGGCWAVSRGSHPSLALPEGFLVAMVFAYMPGGAFSLFWFETSPDPRFAEGTLWILAANVAYLPFCRSREFASLGSGFLCPRDGWNNWARFGKWAWATYKGP